MGTLKMEVCICNMFSFPISFSPFLLLPLNPIPRPPVAPRALPGGLLPPLPEQPGEKRPLGLLGEGGVGEGRAGPQPVHIG